MRTRQYDRNSVAYRNFLHLEYQDQEITPPKKYTYLADGGILNNDPVFSLIAEYPKRLSKKPERQIRRLILSIGAGFKNSGQPTNLNNLQEFSQVMATASNAETLLRQEVHYGIDGKVEEEDRYVFHYRFQLRISDNKLDASDPKIFATWDKTLETYFRSPEFLRLILEVKGKLAKPKVRKDAEYHRAQIISTIIDHMLVMTRNVHQNAGFQTSRCNLKTSWLQGVWPGF